MTHEITLTGKKPLSCKTFNKSFIHGHNLKAHEQQCSVKKTKEAKGKWLSKYLCNLFHINIF